jgi:cytochrome c-type biogenesis protein CcmH
MQMNVLSQCFAKVLVSVFLAMFISAQLSAQLIEIKPEYQKRYHAILEELRCLVCQNQTLADSSSELATDLRVEVKNMLENGRADQEILDFMSARYGDFVLYNPPVKSHTLFLWLGPFVFLLIGVIAALVIVSKRSKSEQGMSDEQQQRVKELLNKK